jgi:hypothetical protein
MWLTLVAMTLAARSGADPSRGTSVQPPCFFAARAACCWRIRRRYIARSM